MNKKKKIVVISVCVSMLLAAMGGTFAWYLREDAKRARTEAATVMAPYNLYLLNPNARDTLQFSVGNLHPGETKQTVICVSNKRPNNYVGDESIMSELAKDSVFGYDLMLIHTDNLAVQYTIYPLERHNIQGNVPAGSIIMEDDTKGQYYWTKTGRPLPGDDITNDMQGRAGTNGGGIVNAGIYWISEDDSMQLAYRASTNSYEYDYYLIEVNWKNITNFDVYKKETDMVYVVVNAKQPRPLVEE